MAEFVGVVIAAVLGFFAVFASIVVSVATFLLAGLAGIFLICALFALFMWGITRDPHALRALGMFLAAGSIPFVATVLLQYYGSKLRDWMSTPRLRRVKVELVPAKVPDHAGAKPVLLAPAQNARGFVNYAQR